LFAVGKTSLITRFMYDSFDNTYQVRNTCELMSVSVWKVYLLQASDWYYR